jgi:hypothetical protein
MAFTDELFRAAVDYALQFPDANSLGTSAATWLTEIARIRRTPFAAILINASATEGANASGLRNFPQQVLAVAPSFVMPLDDGTKALRLLVGF